MKTKIFLSITDSVSLRHRSTNTDENISFNNQNNFGIIGFPVELK